jgi:hypothetical protein
MFGNDLSGLAGKFRHCGSKMAESRRIYLQSDCRVDRTSTRGRRDLSVNIARKASTSLRPFACLTEKRRPSFCAPTRSHEGAGHPSDLEQRGSLRDFFGGTSRTSEREGPRRRKRVSTYEIADSDRISSKAANSEGSLSRTTTYGALRRCGVKPRGLGAGIPGLRCAADPRKCAALRAAPSRTSPLRCRSLAP